VIPIGGDPGMRPDLLRLLATIRGDDCVPGLITTGAVLCQAAARERLLRARLGYLRLQLFGAGDAHDESTRAAGSYAAVLAGLRAWAEASAGECDIDVVLNLRSRPADRLADEVEQLRSDLGKAPVQLIVADDADSPDPLAAAVAPLAGWNAHGERPLLAVENIAEPAQPAEMMAIPVPGGVFVGAATPAATCLGVVDRLRERAAAAAPRVHSNSFNFVRSAATVAYRENADECDAHTTGTADPGRSLWLIAGEDLHEYTTDTGDFDATEIARIKDEWSHLFLDRAAAGVLDDFREGMRRVLPDATCEECAHKVGCGRRFRMVEGQPFAAEEAWIADYVRHLSGRVLDVGCGEQLYRDEIVPLVRNGRISYTGLDPDQPSLDEWREALPEGVFVLGGVEEFYCPANTYDRLLCLRSLNHVFDLDEAIAKMAWALKPGGQLLMVETTPFAMLRESAQVAAADRAPRAGHQHFRNVTSEDVLPYARRRGLRVLRHHPVGLESSNEWILLLTK